MSIDFVSRWLHVWFAGVVIGSAVFQTLTFGPAAKLLSDDQRLLMRERVNSRWSKVVAVTMLVMLITGFYNYLSKKHDGQYHMLMGIKILLALPVFFLSSALAGRSAKLEKFRRNAGLWGSVNLALLIGIVGIASFLKVTKSSVAAPPVAETAPAN
jgi:hypothetical protein